MSKKYSIFITVLFCLFIFAYCHVVKLLILSYNVE